MTVRTVSATLAALAIALAPFAASAAEIGTHLKVDAAIGEARASTTVKAGGGAHIEDAKNRADKEIDRRIDNLTKLIDRINEMKRLTATDQTTLSASIQAQIDDLTALKVKINADDSTTTLKADIQSITKGYRIYALVMPQAAIKAAADRALYTANLMGQFSAKLSARIDAATSSDQTSLKATLGDYDAKVADAKTQAQAAIDAVAALKPDNGDKAVADANLAALKAARAKVQAAQQDLVAARKDAGTIIKALGGGKAELHVGANASTTTSTH